MSNSNQVLRCRVRKSGTGFEGTVYIPGLKPTKLAKKDETTLYTNRSGVTGAAQAVANRYGMTLEVEDGNTPASTKNTRPRTTAAQAE